MSQKKKAADNGLPLGFGMALAQNTQAMECFSHMAAGEQAKYVEKAHHVHSKQEMSALVNSITSGFGV